MPIQFPSGQQYDFGLPQQLEAGVTNMLNYALDSSGLSALISGGGMSATYDGSGRQTALSRVSGRSVAITYPTSTSMVVTEQGTATPAIITATLDAGGRVTAAAGNW